jgi:hypothetical protein
MKILDFNSPEQIEIRAEQMRLIMDKRFREAIQLSSTKEVQACCNVAIKFILANDNSKTIEESREFIKFWTIVSNKINR